jgi:hypothetical protein
MIYEILAEPYDRYCVSEIGAVIDCDFDKAVTPEIDDKGLPYVILSGSHNKTRKFYLHHLVAEYFVRNEYNLTYIYFKDGDKTNVAASNLGYAINPQESKERLARPHRKQLEEERHQLILDINNAIDNGNWISAKMLGVVLWELEGADWSKRND